MRHEARAAVLKRNLSGVKSERREAKGEVTVPAMNQRELSVSRFKEEGGELSREEPTVMRDSGWYDLQLYEHDFQPQDVDLF